MTLLALMPIFSFIAIVFLGTFVFLRNIWLIRTRIFLFLCLATGLWGIGVYGTITVSTASEAKVWFCWYIFMAIAASFLSHFIQLITRREANRQGRIHVFAIYAPVLGFAILTGFQFSTAQLPVKTHFGWVYPIQDVPSYLWFYCAWVATVHITAFVRLVAFSKRSTDIQKKSVSIRIYRIMFLTGLLSILVDILLRYTYGNIPFLSQSISTIFVFALAWHIWRVEFVNPSFAAERILSIMHDCLLIIGPDERIQRVNESVTRLLGYDTMELVGKNMKIIFEPGSYTNIEIKKANLTTLTDSEPSSEIETVFKHKSGEKISVSISESKLINEDGRYVGVVLLARDLTERKLVDEELRRSQKLASLSKLSAGIAHDFNNVLTAVLGNITLLKKKLKEDTEVTSVLIATERAGLAAKALAGQLLTFSSGGEPIKECLYPTPFLNDVVDFTLKGANVKFTIDSEKDLHAVDVDVAQISQAISNIVMNARQAMTDGGVLSITCRNRSTGETGLPFLPREHYVEISFTDHGHGIPKDMLPRVFDPFFTTKDSGSGLGLSVSYSIVKKHDGHLDIASKEGMGTTVRIFLPVSNRIPAEAAKEVEPRMAKTGPIRVLVMDDDEIVRTTFKMILNELDCETDFTEHGTDAIEYFGRALKSNNPYDICFMDLTIPGNIGGREAIVKLREIDPSVKAVVTSGYSDDPVMARFRDYGFSGVLPKPFQFDEVEALLFKLTHTA